MIIPWNYLAMMFSCNKIKKIKKSISQKVLNEIIAGRKININKYGLTEFATEIDEIRMKYDLYKKENNGYPRYWIFWNILNEFLSDLKINRVLKKKNNISNKSNSKYNICYTMFTKEIGFNPTLLSMLIFSKQLSTLTKFMGGYKDFFNIVNFWPPNDIEKKLINNALNKKKIQLVSVVCPDYSYKEIGKNFYSFTFDRLNEGVGLAGKKLLENINKFHSYLKNNSIDFSHDLFFGDFEGFSDKICKRVKESKTSFLRKVKTSSVKANKDKIFNKSKLFVETFSSEERWNSLHLKNKSIIKNKYLSDNNFKDEVEKIALVRHNLYKNWYPEIIPDKYFKFVLDQGAEYSSMAEIINENYDNPIVIGADHPRMKMFYNLNINIPVIYLSKSY